MRKLTILALALTLFAVASTAATVVGGNNSKQPHVPR
jgi:hypothetical protein